MSLRVVLNWLWFVLCVGAGLVLVSKNLHTPDANILNWAVVGLMFYGAYHFYRRADQLSSS